MANCSDAYGTITVQRVGKEFLEFLNTVQGKEEDAWYKLCEIEDFKNAKVDKDGGVSFDFSTMGRWSYGNNLEGYLEGGWMGQDDKNKKAYAKFTEALAKKDGVVVVEYGDNDPSMGWMGKGVAQLEMVEDSVIFTQEFDEQDLTIAEFAKQQGESASWALEYLHGDEAMDAYKEYLAKCKKEKKEPVSADAWYDELYEG